MIRLWVAGEPAPQGSHRAVINPHTGKAMLLDGSSDVGKRKLKAWRNAVTKSGLLWRMQADPLWRAYDGPVQCTMLFFLTRPPSVRREYPTVKPDVDKLVRSTLDGLVDAELLVDDALVVHHSAKKQYARTVTSVPVSPSGAAGCLVKLGPVRTVWEPQ
jgi:Holliday junction resolvase RusA-like endonuclease